MSKNQYNTYYSLRRLSAFWAVFQRSTNYQTALRRTSSCPGNRSKETPHPWQGKGGVFSQQKSDTAFRSTLSRRRYSTIFPNLEKKPRAPQSLSLKQNHLYCRPFETKQSFPLHYWMVSQSSPKYRPTCSMQNCWLLMRGVFICL